jgi:transposase
MRFASFSFTVRQTPAETQALWRHAGAARFAYNQGNHFLHELSSRVVKTHAHVALEDLHVAGMLQNRHLSRSIADAG